MYGDWVGIVRLWGMGKDQTVGERPNKTIGMRQDRSANMHTLETYYKFISGEGSITFSSVLAGRNSVGV